MTFDDWIKVEMDRGLSTLEVDQMRLAWGAAAKMHCENQWRPVSELPPTKDDGYGYETSDTLLVWSKELGVAFGYVVRSNGSKWRWRSNSYSGVPITHWMPLPNPPKDN